MNRKVKAALAAGLVPIVCVGETLEEREGEQTLAVLDRQLQARPRGAVGRRRWRALAVAYEPVWAIGTGRTATAAQAQEAHAHIRGAAAGVVRRRGGRRRAASSTAAA